jgi:hypothetical protein
MPPPSQCFLQYLRDVERVGIPDFPWFQTGRYAARFSVLHVQTSGRESRVLQIPTVSVCTTICQTCNVAPRERESRVSAVVVRDSRSDGQVHGEPRHPPPGRSSMPGMPTWDVWNKGMDQPPESTSVSRSLDRHLKLVGQSIERHLASYTHEIYRSYREYWKPSPLDGEKNAIPGMFECTPVMVRKPLKTVSTHSPPEVEASPGPKAAPNFPPGRTFAKHPSGSKAPPKTFVQRLPIVARDLSLVFPCFFHFTEAGWIFDASHHNTGTKFHRPDYHYSATSAPSPQILLRWFVLAPLVTP